MKHVLLKKKPLHRLALMLFGGLLAVSSCKDSKEPLSDLAGFTSFSIEGFEDIEFTIDQNKLEISNMDSLPYLTSPSGLIANFSTIAGSAVTVGGTVQQSGVTPNDFASAVKYDVTAENGVTVRSYTVKVNIAQIDPNTVSWKRLTENGGWGPYQATSVGYFNNKFWAIAADKSTGTFTYGIFSSADAVSWTKVTPNLSPLPVVVRSGVIFDFKDKIWLLGGFFPDQGFTWGYVTNEIWNSSDGSTWNVKARIPSPAVGEMWPGRERAGAVVFEDKMWIIGGSGYPNYGNTNDPTGPMKDVWSSSDGENWTLVNADPAFIARTNPAVFVHDDKIYMVGGRDADKKLLNDVWVSEDGVTWTEVSVSTPFTARWGHSAVSYNGEIYLIGGHTADGTQNDLWISEDDGESWSKIEAGDPRALPGNFPARAFFSLFVHDNAMWIVGGEFKEGAGTYTYRNDTWKGALLK